MFNILGHQRNADQNNSYILHPQKWPRSKTLITTYAGEVVGKREHFCIAGRNATGITPLDVSVVIS